MSGKNGRKRKSKHFLHYKNNLKSDKKCEKKLFSTLEINRRIASTWNSFTQEIWLNFNKLCAILTF